MKCKITQLEVLVKKNTHTLNRGFSQLSILMGELLQNHSNQSYCYELGNQNTVGYDPLHLEFLESPIIDCPSTRKKYTRFNQPLSKIFQMLQQRNLLKPHKSKPLPNPLPPQINPNLYCDYHQIPGHTTDECHTIKCVV